MNKDGVPFGVLTGILAIKAHQCGFEGNKNLLEADEYKHYLDDLGQKWQVMDLYFKPYTCCRWGHPAIDACVGLMREHGITADDIESAAIRTFHRATLLSKIVPKTADEAQYNIAYPVAAALVYGDFGLAQVREENLGDPKVVEMMKRLSFVVDEELDKQFPARRICRAELVTKDGKGPKTEFVGKSAQYILDKIGITVGPEIKVILMEADEFHPFVQEELMMPILPLVRVKNVDMAIDMAVRVEHGFRHTAIMHSRNVDKLTKMAKLIQTTIFVKNGPSYAGIGVGGMGHTTFTIAGPTGEGLTSAKSFARKRRCVLVGGFDIR